MLYVEQQQQQQEEARCEQCSTSKLRAPKNCAGRRKRHEEHNINHSNNPESRMLSFEALPDVKRLKPIFKD
jgi:hypothetical protein